MATYQILEMDSTGEATQTNGKGAATRQRVFKLTPYTSLPDVYGDLLGGFDVVGGRLVRIYPSRHPLLPWLVCTKVTDVPFDVLSAQVQTINAPGQLGKVSYPAHAIITATYTNPDYTLTDEQADGGDEQAAIDFASESWSYGSRAFTLVSQFYKWKISGDTSRIQDNQVQITIPDISIALVQHYCLRKPTQALTQLSNCINKSSFRITSDTFGPGMLLFKGAEATRKLTTAKGLKYYEMTYKFMVQPLWALCANDPGPGAADAYVTWQRVLNQEKMWWEPLVDRYSGLPIYRYDEDQPSQTIQGRVVKGFKLLFNPGAI